MAHTMLGFHVIHRIQPATGVCPATKSHSVSSAGPMLSTATASVVPPQPFNFTVLLQHQFQATAPGTQVYETTVNSFSPGERATQSSI